MSVHVICYCFFVLQFFYNCIQFTKIVDKKLNKCNVLYYAMCQPLFIDGKEIANILGVYKFNNIIRVCVLCP